MFLPVSEMAQELGNVKVANIIMLGAVVKTTGMLSEEAMTSALSDLMGKKKSALLEANLAALNKGIEVAKKEATA